MASDSKPTSLELKIRWEPAPDVQTLLAQIFNLGAGPDGVQLTIGQVEPPLLSGDPQERAKQVAGLTEAPVRVLGRYSMSLTRARELHKALGEVIASGDPAGATSRVGKRG